MEILNKIINWLKSEPKDGYLRCTRNRKEIFIAGKWMDLYYLIEQWKPDIRTTDILFQEEQILKAKERLSSYKVSISKLNRLKTLGTLMSVIEIWECFEEFIIAKIKEEEELIKNFKKDIKKDEEELKNSYYV